MPDYKLINQGVSAEYSSIREFIEEQVKIAKPTTDTTLAFEGEGITRWSVDEIHAWFPDMAVGYDKFKRITVSWK
jgi:hypothetical protein